MEALNGNIHYQIFCGFRIRLDQVMTNYKLIDSILLELSKNLRIQEQQKVLADMWKPYMKNLDTIYTDATCYENWMRYPTDVKLLWKCIDRVYPMMCKISSIPGEELMILETVTKAYRQQKSLSAGGDHGYSGNANRSFCSERAIETSFSPKGRKSSKEIKSALKQELARVRSTAMEGSFGTQKEHYVLNKIMARIKSTEILLIFFGIHTANAVLLSQRLAMAEAEVGKSCLRGLKKHAAL